MLSRALSLAAVTLLIGCFAAAPAWAQATNLEAGKSPSQIFAGTCNACHKSPRGLLKTVSAGSLQGFLRQHYTTSSEMASLLSAFLVSNGATDTRYGGAQPKGAKEGAKDAKPDARPAEQLDRFGHRLRPAATTQEAAKPDADGIRPEPGNTKRLARPAEATDAAKPDGQAPAQAAIERGPDGRKLTAKQRLSKRGKPAAEELPKTDAGKDAGKEEPAKGEPVKEDKPAAETAKDEGSKLEGAQPAESKPEAAKVEAPKEPGNGETTALRADPVPPVTPAPPVASPPVSTAATSSAPPETPAPQALSAPAPPPTVTASTPPPEPPVTPATPAGPPTPPISK
jgi:hypothetical protein